MGQPSARERLLFLSAREERRKGGRAGGAREGENERMGDHSQWRRPGSRTDQSSSSILKQQTCIYFFRKRQRVRFALTREEEEGGGGGRRREELINHYKNDLESRSARSALPNDSLLLLPLYTQNYTLHPPRYTLHPPPYMLHPTYTLPIDT